MHTGRIISWSGRLDRPPLASEVGWRRRATLATRETGTAQLPIDQPRATTPVPGKSPTAPPLAHSESDSLAASRTAGGLHEFGLGMVPASVTPPASWRRAAWFVVIASAATFGGLLVATATLVNNPVAIDRDDSPNMPRGGQYPPVFSSEPHSEPNGPGPAVTSTESDEPAEAPPRAVNPAARETRSSAARTPEPSPSGSGTPAEPTPSLPSTSASPSSGVPTRPLLGPELLRDRADEHFEAMHAAESAGHELTTDELRNAGFESFARRYQPDATVKVVRVSATSSGAVYTLRLTLPDGSQRTERFIPGHDPLLRAEETATVSKDEAPTAFQH